MQNARRPICSAAMIVEPEPANVSRTIDPRLEQSFMASAIRAIGLTVGCILNAVRAKHIDARIAPDIAACAAMLSEFKCVEMRRLSVLVDEDQFVLAAVKATLTRRGLCPDADVFEFVVNVAASLKQFPDVPPIHADETDGTIDRVAYT